MFINQKKINSWAARSAHIPNGKTVIVGVQITEDLKPVLAKLGFSDALLVGESLMPNPNVGPASKFNSVGARIPQKDKPKEVRTWRQVYRTWKDWHGNEHSGIVSIPNRPSYPVSIVAPPSEYLTIVESDGIKYIVAGNPFIQGDIDEKKVVLLVNLVLESFGMAEVFDGEMKQFHRPAKITRLDWVILPEGTMPWSQLRRHLRPMLDELSKGKKPVVEQRFENITKCKPTEYGIGVNGFKGYVAFVFKHLNLTVLESSQHGNATYIFKGVWEPFSQLTKAELIQADLFEHRLVHDGGWERKLQAILLPQLSKQFTVKRKTMQDDIG